MSPDIYLLNPPDELRRAFDAAFSESSLAWLAVGEIEELLQRIRRRSLVFVVLDRIGLEGLSRLHARMPMSEIVVLGTEGSLQEAMSAMRHGAADYIHPPLDTQELVQAVRRWRERRALKEEAERLSEIITLMELGRALTSNLVLDDLYDQVIELVERAFVPDTVSLMLLNPAGERLRLVAQRGLPPRAAPGTEVTLEESIAGKVVREGQPQLLLGGLEGTSFEGMARRARPIRSAMSIPLQVQGETIGVINVNRYDMRPTYTPNDANLLHVFAAQIAIALKNAQLYDSLREERDRIIKAQEDVRRELARDLHDGLTQVLARLALDLDFLRTQLGGGTVSMEAAQEELANLRGVVRQAIHDVRTMMFGLRPLVLETRGLVAAMEQYLAAMREGDRRTQYHLERGEKLQKCSLSPSVARVIFAILQEAINNARKHSRGNNIWVRLDCRNSGNKPQFTAEVRDDGQGFNLEQVEGSYDDRYSFGLLNMRERAHLIDAVLAINSDPSGTSVRLQVGLQESEAGDASDA